MKAETLRKPVLDSTIANHPFFAINKIMAASNIPMLFTWVEKDWQKIKEQAFQAYDKGRLVRSKRLSQYTILNQKWPGEIELECEETCPIANLKKTIHKEAIMLFISPDKKFTSLESVLISYKEFCGNEVLAFKIISFDLSANAKEVATI